MCPWPGQLTSKPPSSIGKMTITLSTIENSKQDTKSLIRLVVHAMAASLGSLLSDRKPHRSLSRQALGFPWSGLDTQEAPPLRPTGSGLQRFPATLPKQDSSTLQSSASALPPSSLERTGVKVRANRLEPWLCCKRLGCCRLTPWPLESRFSPL